MSEEPNPSDLVPQGVPFRTNASLRFALVSHRLARISYPLACAGPFAFWVMALAYPPTNPRALPILPVQLLWWALCVSSPLGALLGAFALFQIRLPARGVSKRSTEYAIAGLVIGGLASFALVIGMPVLNDIRRQNHGGYGISCLSNVKQLSLGILMYVQDYDDHFPLPHTWNDEIFPYTKNTSILSCPDAPEEEKRPTYAMNRRLENALDATISSPDQTVMLFDSIPGNNLTGGKELFPDPPRHKGYEPIGFVDGHAKMYSPDHLSELLWTPQITKQSNNPQTKTGAPPASKAP